MKSGIEHAVPIVPVKLSAFTSEELHNLTHGNAFPASPVERQLFYRDDEHEWYQYNGTKWVCLSTAAIDALNDIGDVNLPTPANGYVLYWDAAASKWQSRKGTAILTTQGDILIRGAADIERLPKGTERFFLRMGASEPEWVRGYEWGALMLPWQWELYFGHWSTTFTGSGAAPVKDYGDLCLQTGATANSTARARGYKFGWVNWLAQELEWLVLARKDYMTGEGTTGVAWWVMMDEDLAGDPVGQCVGWRLDFDALKGIVHDGTNLHVVDLNVACGDYWKATLFLKFVPGDKVYWYVENVLKGSSANIPTTQRLANVYPVFKITNGATAQNWICRIWRQGWIARSLG